jgi:hypothetical protein
MSTAEEKQDRKDKIEEKKQKRKAETEERRKSRKENAGGRYKSLVNYDRFKKGITDNTQDPQPETSTWKRFRNTIARDTQVKIPIL